MSGPRRCRRRSLRCRRMWAATSGAHHLACPSRARPATGAAARDGPHPSPGKPPVPEVQGSAGASSRDGRSAALHRVKRQARSPRCGELWSRADHAPRPFAWHAGLHPPPGFWGPKDADQQLAARFSARARVPTTRDANFRGVVVLDYSPLMFVCRSVVPRRSVSREEALLARTDSETVVTKLHRVSSVLGIQRTSASVPLCK